MWSGSIRVVRLVVRVVKVLVRVVRLLVRVFSGSVVVSLLMYLI